MNRQAIIASALLLTFMMLISTFLMASETNLNQFDDRGLRDGYWKLTAAMIGESDYAPHQVVEEGLYIEGKKNGMWTRYHKNGNPMYEITYVNDVPHGPYRTFQVDGDVEEKGAWKQKKNVGEFYRYHANGTLAQHFQFDENGVRQGVQYYYYSNGQLAVEVTIRDGREQGPMKRYYRDGRLKEVKVFDQGAVIETEELDIPIAKVESKPVNTPKKEKKEVLRTNEAQMFHETGHNILYNKNRQKTQAGYFKDGRLWDGKYYRYDENGILHRVELYRNGRAVGKVAPEQQVFEYSVQ
ncbi:MAG: hypothetical protein HKN79_00315 [Flavobacteriales bacterium]|nr:hypothetical protein [Flavobacteriales bacterium]